MDVVLLASGYVEHGVKGISSGYLLLDYWDIAKAVAIGAALLLVAHRAESASIRFLGILFLILALEDLITLHGIFAAVLKRLSGGVIPNRVGEFIALAGFGVVAFFFIWIRNPPHHRMLRRARVFLTVLLVTLFFFTAVVDFFALQGSSVTAIVEESGERLTLTITLAYAAGLASIKIW